LTVLRRIDSIARHRIVRVVPVILGGHSCGVNSSSELQKNSSCRNRSEKLPIEFALFTFKCGMTQLHVQILTLGY